MKKCKCGHSKFWHDEDGCHYEEQYSSHTTGGVRIPITKSVTCKCKKWDVRK